MKNKDKKTPKLNANDYILSSDAEAILYGLILVLISLIGFLNYGVVGEALTYIFSYLFGVFYIFTYLLLIFFGLYLMIKKQVVKFHIDLKILGAMLLVLGFCIAASMGNNITINTFFSAYQNQINNAQKHIFSMVSTDAIFSYLGGGIVGYFLVGALNSAITETGTSIVVFVFIGLGFILLFKNLFIRFIKFLVNYHKKRKEVRLLSKQEKETEVIENKVEEKNIPNEFESVKRAKASEIIDYNKLDQQEIKEDQHLEEIKKIIDKPIITNDNKIINDEIWNKKVEINKNKVFIEPLEEKNLKNTKPNDYVLPPLSLLKDHFNNDETEKKVRIAEDRLEKINECFHDFNIGASAISYTIGPSVTRFDVKMNANVKTNVLCSIENDLAVRLGGNKTVRLETIVEGKDTSGIEVGNDIVDIVSFKECMLEVQKNKKDKLLFPLGKNISGEIITCRLDEMPHLLVCGTTGSGKSVFVHNIIVSLLMRNSPDELKLMLIDPKRVEFSKYQGLPHLLCPIITSPDKGKNGLIKLVEEMEKRYELFASKGRGASNYKEYMEICEEMGYEKIPYIVMICDEFADFIENDRENAKLIQRIAQMARACGIYMVIATQRPSVKVITGDIKANIPSRIALSVSSQIDSRTIIDETGAENLLGRGDLLARIPNHKSLIRVQSAYLENREIMDICDFIKNQRGVNYMKDFEDLSPKVVTPYGMESEIGTPYKDFHNDPKFEEIKNYVIKTGKCASGKIQNAFGIGFNKADGILDTLEADGIIKREGNRRVLAEQYRENLIEEDSDE